MSKEQAPFILNVYNDEGIFICKICGTAFEIDIEKGLIYLFNGRFSQSVAYNNKWKYELIKEVITPMTI